MRVDPMKVSKWNHSGGVGGQQDSGGLDQRQCKGESDEKKWEPRGWGVEANVIYFLVT